MPDPSSPILEELDPASLEVRGGEGSWELGLWDGSAWFSEWFYHELHWPMAEPRRSLIDLQPHLTPDAWKSLLRDIRLHLEQRKPFHCEICVELPSGRTTTWQLFGAAECNSTGHPVYLAGSVRDLSAQTPMHEESSSEFTGAKRR